LAAHSDQLAEKACHSEAFRQEGEVEDPPTGGDHGVHGLGRREG